MKTKEKKKIQILLLIAGVLALGLAIQLALIPLAARRQARAAAEAARAETEAAARAAAEATPTLPPSPQPTEAPAPEGPTVEEGDILLLVNGWNPVPEGYVPELAELGEKQSIDLRCADALREMLADCAETGAKPILCSSYRTQEDQTALYEDKIRRLLEEGTDPEEAPAVAAMSVAIPGTSEHQLGLAADIIDEDYVILDEGQEQTATQQWLMENSWRYGFILRYPNGTTAITGIIYEPWHYRYVGPHAAAEIYARGITLEEYLELLV